MGCVPETPAPVCRGFRLGPTCIDLSFNTSVHGDCTDIRGMHSEVTTATAVSALTQLCLVRGMRHEPQRQWAFCPKGSCTRHESCSQLRQYRLHPVHTMDLLPFRSRPCAGLKFRLIIRPQPKMSTTGSGFRPWRIEERRCTTHIPTSMSMGFGLGSRWSVSNSSPDDAMQESSEWSLLEAETVTSGGSSCSLSTCAARSKSLSTLGKSGWK